MVFGLLVTRRERPNMTSYLLWRVIRSYSQREQLKGFFFQWQVIREYYGNFKTLSIFDPGMKTRRWHEILLVGMKWNMHPSIHLDPLLDLHVCQNSQSIFKYIFLSQHRFVARIFLLWCGALRNCRSSPAVNKSHSAPIKISRLLRASPPIVGPTLHKK